MTVYVDDARKKYGRMIMSHMYATDMVELFDMVNEIGVDMKHFQDHRIPHFDICQSMRKKACELGAFQVTTRQMIQIHNSLKIPANPKLEKVNLWKGSNKDYHNHPDIKTDGTQYLIKHRGQYFAGRFYEVWFGLNFHGWHGTPLQYDKPGCNRSGWEAVWEIIEES